MGCLRWTLLRPLRCPPLLREAPGPLLRRLRQGATLEHSLLWARIGEHDPELASFGSRLVRTEPTEPRELAELIVHALAGKSPWSLLRLVCPFGGKQAEVDLLAQELRIAVEIDGYYHFQGQDTYRRDRRKDFELQHRGYLVLRFLEQDIVARLEEILSQLHTAGLWRQKPRSGSSRRSALGLSL